MNHNHNKALMVRLRIEALLTHWGLQVAGEGSRLTVPWEEFVTGISVETVAAGIRVGVRTALGNPLLAEEAALAIKEPLPVPDGHAVVMDEDHELGLVWVRDYSGTVDPEQVGNAMLAQVEAARKLVQRLGEDCYLQKPRRGVGETAGRGGR